MNKLNFLQKFAQDYIECYWKYFHSVEQKVIKKNSIKRNLFEFWKNYDSWPLQNRYSDYSFLDWLSIPEKNKIILLYAIRCYIQNTKEMESLKLNTSYILTLDIDIDDDIISNSVTIFPEIH